MSRLLKRALLVVPVFLVVASVSAVLPPTGGNGPYSSALSGLASLAYADPPTCNNKVCVGTQGDFRCVHQANNTCAIAPGGQLCISDPCQ